ncbi:MAG: acyl-CoA reductase [Vicingaceae bacterium]
MNYKAKRAFIGLAEDIDDYLGEKKGDAIFHRELDRVMVEAFQWNAWFTEENISYSLKGIVHMLDPEKIEQWEKSYNSTDQENQRTIGLIMAGNLPLVGFHDLLCVLFSGNNALVKMSSDDSVLLPLLLDRLFHHETSLAEKVRFCEKLTGYDAVIATGSNNSARYFDYYFNNVPNIIRRNRNSVAVLTGEESSEELKMLGLDLFTYFGLGCRNVSKVYIPKDFDLNRLFEAIVDYGYLVQHNKYGNNYDYYKAIYLMNSDKLIENGFLLVKEDSSLHSPVAMLFYERYQDLNVLSAQLIEIENEIQCIVSNTPTINNCIPLGKSQLPELWEYADGIDTMKFLLEL